MSTKKKNGKGRSTDAEIIKEAVESDASSVANDIEHNVAQAFLSYDGDVKRVLNVLGMAKHEYEKIVSNPSYQAKYVNLVLAYKLWPKLGMLVDHMVEAALEGGKEGRHFMKMAMDLVERAQKANSDEGHYGKEEMEKMFLNMLSRASNDLGMPLEKVIEYLRS